MRSRDEQRYRVRGYAATRNSPRGGDTRRGRYYSENALMNLDGILKINGFEEIIDQHSEELGGVFAHVLF